MVTVTRLTNILALFTLLILPACAQSGSSPASATSVAPRPAIETEVAPNIEPTAALAAAPTETLEVIDPGAAPQITEEPPAVGAVNPTTAPSPEPTQSRTGAPTATSEVAATVTEEPPTPTVTAVSPAAADLTAEATGQPSGAQKDEAAPETVTGVVMGNSGTTAELVEQGISIDVTGLASTYAWLVVPISEGVVDPLPRHILLTFDEDDPAEMVTENGRRLYVFPLRPYLALYVTDGLSAAAEQVERLGELIAAAQERTSDTELPPDDWMPLLPLAEDGRLLTWEQFADVNFSGGQGVRFLSDFSGTPTYYFQGLTDGDRYYLSLFWPLIGENPPSLEALDGLAASFAIGETAE